MRLRIASGLQAGRTRKGQYELTPSIYLSCEVYERSLNMNQSTPYEIIETRYQPKAQTSLDFTGTLEDAKKKAVEEAKKNIGVRYAVFRQGSSVAEFQAYYKTTVKCPKCGEIIPVE
jgi:hypothetical protein